MPVPTVITDLSTTAASNSPAGSESARGTVDDYLRAHAAFIAQTRAGAPQLDGSGNLLVGASTDAGLVSNLKKMVSGIFSTVNGSVSATNANGTALFTIPDVNSSTWLVSAQLQSGNTASYAAFAIICTQNGSFRIMSNIAGTLLTISQGSGLIVQATQSSGATATIHYSAIRVM